MATLANVSDAGESVVHRPSSPFPIDNVETVDDYTLKEIYEQTK